LDRVEDGLLTVTVAEHAPYCVVAVSGELDVYTTARLRAVLQERLVDAGDVHLVVDLSGLTFMDSTGLGALVRVHKQARNLRGTLAVVCGDGPVRRVIALTGMLHVLRVFDSLEAATAASAPGT
jgi:anti-sigma B factor antagonist